MGIDRWRNVDLSYLTAFYVLKGDFKLCLTSLEQLDCLTGEDDIENIVKQIEAEEQKRKEVKELSVNPPSHRQSDPYP